MAPTSGGAKAHRFDQWEIRPDERVLLVAGVPAKVQARAFDLLLALVQRGGRVATKDELLATVWPGLVVEENNLSVQVSALRKLLGPQAIATVPGRGYRLAAQPRPDDAGVPPPAPAAPPEAGPPLFGREADLQALQAQLGQAPLLSIVGSGGVGKTSVARALLSRRAWPLRDGVHWIDLAPLRSGAPLTALVARALGLMVDDFSQPSDDVQRALGRLQALVALDNCEHLLPEVAALLSALLRTAPGIRWLATSQEPLHLPGEAVYRLQPLQVPAPGAPLAQALTCGALALLCDRARSADRRFALGPELLGTAVQLCRQLDGLPLAIEMAAARVATLGLQVVHDQIDLRLRLRASTRGTPDRQHTLLQTFEWSYRLLSPNEQRVFRRLQPFVDGFSLPLAQALCCAMPGDDPPLDRWQMLDALSALVDKSLVQRWAGPAGDAPGGGADSPGGAGRLHLLESARDFARLQLDAAGETAAVRQRHAEVVAAWFDSAQADLARWRDADWAAHYLPERRNVGEALGWTCQAGTPELLARLVTALAQLDAFSNAQPEVLQYPVPLPVLQQAAPPLRAWACCEFGWAQFLDGSRALGSALSQQAVQDFEALGDAVGLYTALARLVRLCQWQPGREADARQAWQRLKQLDESSVPLRTRLWCEITVAPEQDGRRSVERLRDLQDVAQLAGYDMLAAICRMNVTDELLRSARYDEVVHTCQALLRQGEPQLIVRGFIRHNLALALVRLGRLAEAREAAQALLRSVPSLAHVVIDMFALVAVRAGRAADAALMAGCSQRFKQSRNWHLEPAEAALIDETQRLMDAALGAARLAELRQLGAAMPVDDVLALAWRETG